LLQERTKNAQFIIISLRNNMFELADRLVGIYKTYHCTKSVTINPHRLQLPLQELNGTQQMSVTNA
jgi:structural maintenance of chromosome 4